MIKKTIIFSNPAKLSLADMQMVIDTKSDKGIITRPIEDIGIMIVESKCVTLTSALLSALLNNNTAVVFCNDSHLPSGMLLAFSGNTLMNQRSMSQIAASAPLKKQLWQQTVSSKILNQAINLSLENPDLSECMYIWSKKVKSGDSDNLEARAANYYWKNLIKERDKFKRSDSEDFINTLLNYGYAILRALVARAIVGAGLIASIGIFHSNKYNSYCLADDIMEPYRPYVDRLVLSTYRKYDNLSELTPKIKKDLLSIPVIDVHIGNVKRPLMIAVEITASSLCKCYCGESRKIVYPQFGH